MGMGKKMFLRSMKSSPKKKPMRSGAGGFGYGAAISIDILLLLAINGLAAFYFCCGRTPSAWSTTAKEASQVLVLRPAEDSAAAQRARRRRHEYRSRQALRSADDSAVADESSGDADKSVASQGGCRAGSARSSSSRARLRRAEPGSARNSGEPFLLVEGRGVRRQAGDPATES